MQIYFYLISRINFDHLKHMTEQIFQILKTSYILYLIINKYQIFNYFLGE